MLSSETRRAIRDRCVLADCGPVSRRENRSMKNGRTSQSRSILGTIPRRNRRVKCRGARIQARSDLLVSRTTSAAA
jgi:hypothetical protein